MRTQLLTIGAVLVVVAGAGRPAEARTWRVERDGSGDFATLQPALDAAAAGDTVRIGAGRYTETAPFTTAGWTEDTHVAVKADSLVLIGAGAASTIIGPAQFDGTAVDLKGIAMARELSHLTVQSLTVEHVWHGLFAFGRLVILESTFRGCHSGLVLLTPAGTQVLNDHFENCIYNGIITGTDTRDVQISGCTFVGNALGIGINRTQNAVVSFCTFEGGGVQYSDGSTGAVHGCSFSGIGPIRISLGSSASITSNRVAGSELGLWVTNFSHVLGERNVIQGASYATLRFSGGSTADFHRNHFLKGAGPTVRVEAYVLDPIYIDLTDNFWGTTSADSISAWILDGNDPHPPWETWNGFVVFQPFAEQPVPAETKSFGSLKSLFRSGGQ